MMDRSRLVPVAVVALALLVVLFAPLRAARAAEPVSEASLYDLCSYAELRAALLRLVGSERPGIRTGSEGEKDGLRERFERWDDYVGKRVYPSGVLPPPTILWDELKRYEQTHPQAPGPGPAAATFWTPLGPVGPISSTGIGRVNTIAFDPVNPNIVWAGTPAGGLWKSVNSGGNWATTTDQLPNLGVSAIAINPQNTQEMYIGTGDAVWAPMGGPYSMGILKSIDGGVNWSSGGLVLSMSAQSLIFALAIDPVAVPTHLFAATNQGLWATTTGGATWSLLQAGVFTDVQVHPGNPSVMFAASIGSPTLFWSSTNSGVTWSAISTLTASSQRAKLALSTAAPAPPFPGTVTIYAATGDDRISKSVNDGASWVTLLNPTGQLVGTTNIAIGVSPLNANQVVVGGVGALKSIDGGANWTSFCPTHVDKHAFVFTPPVAATTALFEGNDGGVYMTGNFGATCQERNTDLAITQFYRLGGSPTDANVLQGGSQDNGTFRRTGAGWGRLYPGDGMETIVDPTDPNLVFFSQQNGAVWRYQIPSSLVPIAAGGMAPFVTTYAMHPADRLTLYFLRNDYVYRTNDQGMTPITPISGSLRSLSSLAVAPSNGDVVYVGSYWQIFRSDNANQASPTWTTLISPSPQWLSGLAVDPVDPMTVWATYSGFGAGDKVWRSTNGGVSWTNLSGTLPNVPVDTILTQRNSLGAVFLGTDLGVFYRNNTMSDWVWWNDGAPNTRVDELEIHYATCKIRAATFGRGMWERDLPSCGLTTGACCSGAPPFACTQTSALFCSLVGGCYKGDGVPCEPNNPCTVGACCYTGDQCAELTEAGCNKRRGQWCGPCKTCTQASCLVGGCF